MGSTNRRSQRRERSGGALSVLGDVLLVLATLAVGGLVAYLVLNPPGVLDPASQQAALPTPPTSTDPAAVPVDPAAVPPAVPPAAPPIVGLSLGPACGAVSPLLAQADEVRNTALEDPDALVSEEISALTRDMQALSDISPPELNTLIDTLTDVLVGLNNALLAGDENPDLDNEAATGTTDAIRVLCEA